MANAEEVKLSEWLASKAGLTGQKYDVALKQFKENFTGMLSSMSILIYAGICVYL